jgi:wyosine [tRNA(Phe)-imidazoG37] synthetase (radical SAM superfamily)
MEADIVSPSLDAVTPKVFEKVDRPNPKLNISVIIDGIRTFRKEYKGRMWMEILFVEGMNDHDEEVFKMKQVIDEIQPEKIHLNTVIRPPAYSIAKPVSEKRLREIQKILGERSEIIGSFQNKHETDKHKTDKETILILLRRRAMTADQMVVSLGMRKEDITLSLKEMCQTNITKSYTYEGEEYFQAL